jgi:hypothetical protein
VGPPLTPAEKSRHGPDRACPRCGRDPDLARRVVKDLADAAQRLRGADDHESWMEFVRAYDRLRDAPAL